MLAQEEMLPHYTYEDYVNWEGDWELIIGIPYAMSPSPIAKHQRIATSLSGEFYSQLKQCELCNVYQQLDYKIAEDTVVQPDIIIACGNMQDKKFVDFPPSLVVEVLSPSTALKDRHIKYPIYERQGVKYFLIISPEKEVVEIYELTDGEYDLKFKGHSTIFDFDFDNCSARIDFNQIW